MGYIFRQQLLERRPWELLEHGKSEKALVSASGVLVRRYAIIQHIASGKVFLVGLGEAIKYAGLVIEHKGIPYCTPLPDVIPQT